MLEHLEAHLDVRDARLIVIHDVWVGYNELAPITAVYELRRTRSGGFAGEGRFATRIAKAKPVPIAMRSAAASAFLDVLASAEIVPGEYEPSQLATDDYPRIQIAVHVGAKDDREGGIALLHTESQGDYHTPWAVFVAGVAYVIESDAIGRAYRALDRPLKRAELLRLGA